MVIGQREASDRLSEVAQLGYARRGVSDPENREHKVSQIWSSDFQDQGLHDGHKLSRAERHWRLSHDLGEPIGGFPRAYHPRNTSGTLPGGWESLPHPPRRLWAAQSDPRCRYGRLSGY